MAFVYRDYDQPELERQLNARATVPDIAPILTRYACESARMRAHLPCQLSVSYGASMPSPYDPSAHSLTSGRGQDARARELQDLHNQAKKLAGIKGEVLRHDQGLIALLRALLGIKHPMQRGHGRG